jgi:hypothetical protein
MPSPSSHDRVGRFTEPSYRPPNLAEYQQVAHDFIGEVAPELVPEVRDRLANEVSRRTFGLIGASSRQGIYRSVAAAQSSLGMG